MPRIDLFGPQKTNLSVTISNSITENCYTVPAMKGRNGVALVGSMGSKVFSSTTGIMRGCYKKEVGGKVYFVIGTTLYEIESSGSSTNLGTVPGVGRVSIDTDGDSIIVVNGTDTGYYYNRNTSIFSTVTLPAKAYTIAFLDSYIGFSSDDQRWYISEVGDSDSFDALDFASSIKSPDPLLAIWEDHSEFILFGEETIEPWPSSSDVDFPFARNTAGVMERGIYSRFSVADEDNTLFFLGDDLVVYRLEGYLPVRVSDDSVETELSDILKRGSVDNLKNTYAFTYVEHGHKFYQLTVPNERTFTYNIVTKEWHRLKHWDYATHHSVCYCKAFGKHLIGGLDGRIYELSRKYYDDAGKVLRRLKRGSYESIEDRLIKWKKIKFIFEFGTTPLVTGQGSTPKVIVRWSDDSTRAFRSKKFLTLGRSGEYQAKAIKRNCGSSRNRIFECYVTDPVPFFLLDAYVSVN